MLKGKASRGFTIVELLIVIIVIGILAALVLVAYSNVSDQAKSSAAKNDLEQIAKQLNLYKENTGGGTSYPADASSLSYSSGTSVQYSVNNSASPATYCVTATNGNKSFYLSNAAQSPVAGGCPGHGVNGQSPVTNYAQNPSSETSILTINNNGNDATIIRDTTDSYSGSASTKFTKSANYVFVNSNGSYGTSGQTVMVSAWVKASTGTVRMVQRGGNVPYSTVWKTFTAGVWTRVSQAYTIPSGATSFYIDFGYESSDAASGSTLAVDAIMATQGSTLYNYADGNTASWIWNGATNNSTSTGPGI